MDVLALPSLTTPRWKEQFGRVLIEAQACGVPVVGSDSGAIPEVIGKSGLLFPEGDAPKLAGELKRLAGSPGLRKSLGPKGRNQVLSRYTNQKIADQIHRVYRTLA
jgi:glycosyltransferase involved in cell wall biosynthesis